MGKQTSEPSSGKPTEANIDGDVSDSVIVTGNGNVINVGDKITQNRSRRKTKKEPRKVNWSSPAIVAAVIVGIATIVAALLNSPLFVNPAEPTPTATASSIPTESAMATEYFTSTPIIVVVTSTEITPTFTFTPKPEDTPASSPSPEAKVSTMKVVLQSTLDEGKAPLKVNFDARTSYVTFADGSMATCGNNRFCAYVFAIYRDGNLVEKIRNSDGTLSYTFSARGKYWATVYVCRGDACEDDGIEIIVK